jgi:hypothetical protein
VAVAALRGGATHRANYTTKTSFSGGSKCSVTTTTSPTSSSLWNFVVRNNGEVGGGLDGLVRTSPVFMSYIPMSYVMYPLASYPHKKLFREPRLQPLSH